MAQEHHGGNYIMIKRKINKLSYRPDDPGMIANLLFKSDQYWLHGIIKYIKIIEYIPSGKKPYYVVYLPITNENIKKFRYNSKEEAQALIDAYKKAKRDQLAAGEEGWYIPPEEIFYQALTPDN